MGHLYKTILVHECARECTYEQPIAVFHQLTAERNKPAMGCSVTSGVDRITTMGIQQRACSYVNQCHVLAKWFNLHHRCAHAFVVLIGDSEIAPLGYGLHENNIVAITRGNGKPTYKFRIEKLTCNKCYTCCRWRSWRMGLILGTSLLDSSMVCCRPPLVGVSTENGVIPLGVTLFYWSCYNQLQWPLAGAAPSLSLIAPTRAWG